jgi:hypothetical protein
MQTTKVLLKYYFRFHVHCKDYDTKAKLYNKGMSFTKILFKNKIYLVINAHIDFIIEEYTVKEYFEGKNS